MVVDKSGMGETKVSEKEGTSGALVLIVAFAWATLALGGYFLMLKWALLKH